MANLDGSSARAPGSDKLPLLLKAGTSQGFPHRAFPDYRHRSAHGTPSDIKSELEKAKDTK